MKKERYCHAVQTTVGLSNSDKYHLNFARFEQIDGTYKCRLHKYF